MVRLLEPDGREVTRSASIWDTSTDPLAAYDKLVNKSSELDVLATLSSRLNEPEARLGRQCDEQGHGS